MLSHFTETCSSCFCEDKKKIKKGCWKNSVTKVLLTYTCVQHMHKWKKTEYHSTNQQETLKFVEINLVEKEKLKKKFRWLTH